jgi:hypothetical protein
MIDADPNARRYKEIKNCCVSRSSVFCITELLHERTNLWANVNETVLLTKYGGKESQSRWTGFS